MKGRRQRDAKHRDADRLATLRKCRALGWSLALSARAAGVSTTTAWRMLHGQGTTRAEGGQRDRLQPDIF